MSSPAPNFAEADHLLGSARNMREACSALLENDRPGGEQKFVGTIHFLLGFSAELYLKAALAQKGLPPNERYGHDLLALLQSAESEGVIQFSEIEEFRRLVGFIAKDHKANSFRYLKPESEVTVIRNLPVALSVLESLDRHLWPRVKVQTADASP
jgi:hypothetical protein